MSIMLDSLRNGYTHLQSNLSSFLLDRAVFKGCGWTRDRVYIVLSALDVEAELCNMLADRGVSWKDKRLHVSGAFEMDPEILEWLCQACMTDFSFKAFSSRRFISLIMVFAPM